MERGARMFGRATFVMDSGYDDNKMFLKLLAINALNFYITLCMAFLAHMSMKPETNAVKVSIIQKADPVKKVLFCYYRLAKGICGILSYAKKASGYVSGQSVRCTVNSALS